MATREQDFQEMFGRMDRNEFSAPSVKSALPASDDFHVMFQKMDANHPDEMASMFDRMDRTRVTSSVNENVDFSTEPAAPVPDAKPIEFTPSDTISEMSILQRAAEGFRQLGSNDKPMRKTDPNLLARQVTLTIPDRGRKPSQQEVTDAYFDALGASDVNSRYKAETGRDIETPDVSDEDLTMGYDPQSKTYKVKVAPTQSAIAVINAYGQGGLKAAQDALRDIQRADDEAAAKEAQGRDAARNVMRGMGYDPDELEGSPLARGLSRAGLGATRAINNLSAVARNPSDAANDAAYINDATASIPRSRSTAGRIVEDVTAAGASLPLYTAAGPYGAGLVGFTQNLDRGTEAATKEGLKLAGASGVAHGVGLATEDWSPLARQIAARKASGLTNVAIDKLSGSNTPAVESFITGAAMPVGAKGKGESEGFASTRPLSEAPATKRAGFLSEVNAVVQIPRGVEASFDDSAVLRQNLILGVLNPKKAASSFVDSIKALSSEERADKILDDLHSDPAKVQKRQDAGLYLASENRGQNTSFLNREEPFGSKWSQRIPGIKQSERAYTVATDTLRASVFDAYADAHPDATPETLRGVARFINYASGRGSLTGYRGIDKTLAQVFYSPRLAISRPQLLSTAIKNVTPEATRYARAELTKYFAATAGFLGLARLAGAQVSFNPIDPDFAKLRIGNMRIDLGAGYAQLFRYTSQVVSGRARSLNSGREYDLGKDERGGSTPTRGDVAERFIRTKLSPQAGIIINLWSGKDLQGQPTGLRQEAQKLLVPLSFGDVYDAYQDAGLPGAALGTLSLLGAGIQTIKPKSQDEKLNDVVQRMKAAPENQGLSDAALRHNAKVSIEENRLLQSVPDEKKEEARRTLNTLFYYSKVRGSNDRRALPAIERVFNGRLESAVMLLKRRGLMK